MKGGIASILTAIAAIRRSDVVLRRPVTVQFVVGEEDGGLGAFATLRRHPTGDFCIIPEPTNLQVIGDAAGALSFRITVPGSSAHASMRHLGVSSVEKYILVHRALQDLEARRNAVVEHGSMRHLAIPYAISIGKLQSGDWASTVPDVLVAEGRIGVRLGEPPEVARAELETAVASVCAGDGWLSTHPASVEWIGGQFASSHLPAASPLIGLVSSAHWDANGADHPRSIGVPYGSDMRLYHAAGIPTVHYGPGDPQLAHSADECIPVYQVTRAARTLAVLILRTSHEIRM